MKINETHPSLAAEFRKGRFGIKRTSKNFSRMPIDLTQEQTIHADAASQRTDINAFTNSISARQRGVRHRGVRYRGTYHPQEVCFSMILGGQNVYTHLSNCRGT